MTRAQPMDEAAYMVMHQRLYHDDADALKGEYDLVHLNIWMERNILHVWQACPKIREHWLNAPPAWKYGAMHVQTAMALESMSEDDKIAMFLGRASHPAARGLHAYWVAKNSGWRALSPAWIGQHGSALRQTIEGLGWTPKTLVRQLMWCMNNRNMDTWLPSVPYAYSLRACSLASQALYRMDPGGARPVPPSVEHFGSSD